MRAPASSKKGVCHVAESRYRKNDIDVVRMLISSGDDINQADEEGMTPLMWAAQAQSPEMVELLVTLGANPKVKDKKGYDAMGIACWYGEASMGYYTWKCRKIISILKKVGLRLNP